MGLLSSHHDRRIAVYIRFSWWLSKDDSTTVNDRTSISLCAAVVALLMTCVTIWVDSESAKLRHPECAHQRFAPAHFVDDISFFAHSQVPSP
jgi:hypothetical protein